MNCRPVPRARQGGFTLAEALVAIFIFSLGILGFVAFRTAAAREVTEAKVRTEASFLAGQLVAEMWSNRKALADYDTSGQMGPPLLQWYEIVKARLPGSDSLPPIVTTNKDDGKVAITMRWRMPGSSAVHLYRTTTQLSDP